MPSVSIVVPTRNRAAILRHALGSMVQQTWPAGDYEIIVVDNDSTDETYGVVREMAARSRVPVRYVREPRVGLHRARHAGAIHARGDVVLYGEDDIVAAEDWVDKMARSFRGRPKLGAVGGKISPHWANEPPDWLPQLRAQTSVGLLGLLDLGEGFFILPSRESVYGGNFAVRKSVLFETGGFNPDGVPEHQLIYRGDGEIGLQKKIRGLGYDVAYNGKAVVQHVIDGRRLTKDYVLARAHREGYSRAYSRYRDHHGAFARMLLGSFVTAIRWLVMRTLFTVSRRKRRRLLREALFCALASDVQHSLRILMRRDLQQYVLRHSYFEEAQMVVCSRPKVA